MFVDAMYHRCRGFRIFHIKNTVKEDHRNDPMDM